MATNASWTVVFDDKMIIKNHAEGAEQGVGYIIQDNDFWGLAKWSNIWAIQYGTANPNDTVEYRDDTPHSTWEAANLGDFSDFINRWDAHHLSVLQSNWDNDNVEGESESDKIARLGARPTSYSS
jgi:hypothetical protein|tara:strand:- start:3497 stop:3871 length:375 start_codon:yes stop_codon:yes gene_type:complete